MKILVLAAFLASTAALVAGCGSGGSGGTCEDSCAASDACPGTTPTESCSAACSDGASLASASGCTSEYDAWLSCEAGLSNACEASPCNQQNASLISCVTPYCSAHPGTKLCP